MMLLVASGGTRWGVGEAAASNDLFLKYNFA